MAQPFLQTRAGALRPLLVAFVPAASALSDAELEESLALSERTLAGRPEALRRQAELAVKVLLWLLRLRFRRAPGRVPAEQVRAFLDRLQEAPVLKLRLAVWGVRTLLFAGYYGHPARQGELGYHPSPRGWEAVRGGAP